MLGPVIWGYWKMNGSNERKRSKLQARGSRVATRGEFPGGPMVRTYLVLSLQWLGSIPDWGTKIPQALWCKKLIKIFRKE